MSQHAISITFFIERDQIYHKIQGMEKLEICQIIILLIVNLDVN